MKDTSPWQIVLIGAGFLFIAKILEQNGLKDIGYLPASIALVLVGYAFVRVFAE